MEIFEIDFSTGPAFALHQRAVGRVDEQYDWASLDPAAFPPLLVERARLGWTENAFNEFCTAAAIGQLVQTMGQARVPLDLWTVVTGFAREELLHVELCSRMAMQLGGGAPIGYEPRDLEIPLDPSLTPLEKCNELVIRLLCVGETLSLPLLTGCMKSATHPLTRAVLRRIVQDEALHGRLGFLYLDWIANELTSVERDRLGRAAADTLAHHAPIWERLRSRTIDGRTSEGFEIDQVHQLGWMESGAYASLAREQIESSIRQPLAGFGIRMGVLDR